MKKHETNVSGTTRFWHAFVMYIYDMHFVFQACCALRRERVLSRAFGFGESQGGVGTLRRISGSRPSTVAVLGALSVADLAIENKGSLSASPSRVGDTLKTPHFLFFRK